MLFLLPSSFLIWWRVSWKRQKSLHFIVRELMLYWMISLPEDWRQATATLYAVHTFFTVEGWLFAPATLIKKRIWEAQTQMQMKSEDDVAVTVSVEHSSSISSAGTRHIRGYIQSETLFFLFLMNTMVFWREEFLLKPNCPPHPGHERKNCIRRSLRIL